LRADASPARDSGRRARVLAALALLAGLWAIDLARSPGDQWTAAALIGAIGLYQESLSPRMPDLGIRCRFVPTCSRYAAAVIARDGALVGGGRALARVARCGPWTEAGTVDPP
jgi:hypothetical protein